MLLRARVGIRVIRGITDILGSLYQQVIIKVRYSNVAA